MFVECMKIEIVLEYQLIEGVLPRAQRHSTIPFLYKKDHDVILKTKTACSAVKNLKVLSKAFERQLQRVLPKLIIKMKSIFVRTVAASSQTHLA